MEGWLEALGKVLEQGRGGVWSWAEEGRQGRSSMTSLS